MIRNRHLQDVYDGLKGHNRFEIADFEINQYSRSTESEVRIKYLGKEEFVFSIKIPIKVDHTTNFNGECCPGKISYREQFSLPNLGGWLSNRINDWVSCVWEELSTDPIVREVDKQRKEIDDLFKKIKFENDTAFDSEEINSIKSRLNEIEIQFIEELKKSIEDKQQLARELQELKTDFETLKVTLKTLKRTGWAKGYFSKAFKWVLKSENRSLLKEGYSLVKQLLPENVGSTLP